MHLPQLASHHLATEGRGIVRRHLEPAAVRPDLVTPVCEVDRLRWLSVASDAAKAKELLDGLAGRVPTLRTVTVGVDALAATPNS